MYIQPDKANVDELTVTEDWFKRTYRHKKGDKTTWKLKRVGPNKYIAVDRPHTDNSGWGEMYFIYDPYKYTYVVAKKWQVTSTKKFDHEMEIGRATKWTKMRPPPRK